MKYFISPVFVLLVTTFFSSNLYAIDLELINKVNDTSFEVVVKKVESENIEYERELPWDLIDFNTRSDEYFSIGTAFAISPTKFVTAAHVLSFQANSLVYQEYYIRDSDKNVYLLDKVTKFNDAKDFAVFTVKDFEAKDFLSIRDEPYKKTEKVYQVGNIYGQGLVSVPATILGEMPESRNGEWVHIKSSPPNDSGSSGGPLLDENLNVLGVILMKNDTFSYSLPMQDILAGEENKGIVDRRITVKLALLGEDRGDLETFKMEVPLPERLPKIKEIIHEEYKNQYQVYMDRFFKKIGGLFPEGANSERTLQNFSNSNGIELVFRSSDDKQWNFSVLDKTTSNLTNDNAVSYVAVGSSLFFDYVKSDGVPAKELYGTSATFMNHFLEGIPLARTIGSEQIRITSLGEPFESELFTDKYDRPWHLDSWLMSFGDQVVLAMWTPVPDGVVGVFTLIKSGNLNEWKYDFNVIASLIKIPYVGTLKEWQEFTSNDLTQGILKDVQFEYKAEEMLTFGASDFDLVIKNEDFNLEEHTSLYLGYDFFLKDGKPTWDIRKWNLNESRSNNYVVYYRATKPPADLGEDYHLTWEDLVENKAPYNKEAEQKDGFMRISGAHPDSDITSSYLYTVTVGLEGIQDADVMSKKLNLFNESVTFIK